MHLLVHSFLICGIYKTISLKLDSLSDVILWSGKLRESDSGIVPLMEQLKTDVRCFLVWNASSKKIGA